MSLNIKCDKCGKELDEPGALVFSPPSNNKDVMKYHICKTCWAKLADWIYDNDKRNS